MDPLRSNDPLRGHAELMTRRYFLGRNAAGIGTVALASLLNERLLGPRRDSQSPEFSDGRTFQPRRSA